MREHNLVDLNKFFPSLHFQHLELVSPTSLVQWRFLPFGANYPPKSAFRVNYPMSSISKGKAAAILCTQQKPDFEHFSRQKWKLLHSSGFWTWLYTSNQRQGWCQKKAFWRVFVTLINFLKRLEYLHKYCIASSILFFKFEFSQSELVLKTNRLDRTKGLKRPFQRQNGLNKHNEFQSLKVFGLFFSNFFWN